MNESEIPKTRIPVFSSIAEEAAFWDSHDTAEFEDEFEPVDLRVSDEARRRSRARRAVLRGSGEPIGGSNIQGDTPSGPLDRNRYGTSIQVRISGDYLSHAELAPLLDELNEHFFTVAGRRDNWEGPMAGGSEVVMWVAVTGGTAVFIELAKDAYKLLRTRVLETFHEAGERKKEHRGEIPTMVIEAEGVKFILDEYQGEIDQVELADAFRAVAKQLEAGEVRPTPGPIETFPKWDRRSKSWRVPGP